MKIKAKRAPAATHSVASRKGKLGTPGKPAVLIVDDDFTMREMISMILKRLARVRTLRAATNAEAFRKARRYEIAAVVSDLVRPGGSGFEFLKQFRKEHPKIPVIISSGNYELSNLRRAKRLGAFAFFPKPYKGEALAEVVIAALRSVGREPRQR